MSGRESGIRHALDYARRARKALDEGKVSASIADWGHARAHLGFTVGLAENPNLSLASVLLRKALLNMGTRIERAITPRADVPGYIVAEPIAEIFIELTDEYPIATETITDLAARAAVAILNRYDVKERS